VKKKSIWFDAGDLIFYEPADQRQHTVLVLLDRFHVPVGEANHGETPINRYFWHAFDTAKHARISMYEKKMRHEIKKNPDVWRLIKKN